MNKRRDLALANSRPEGGNDTRPLYINQLQDLLKNQWKKYTPSWFITIQWTPAPYDYSTTSKHAKHFRNKLLTYIYACNLEKLPRPQHRCKLIWFHERAQDPSGRFIYHSHLHLTQVPGVLSAHHLQWVIAQEVAPGFKCLKNLNRQQNPAVVIRRWDYDHHAFYNLKDHYRFKHHQDSDLILDYITSDLIPA